MAGIGFELRKMLRRDSLSGMLSAYAYAGVISSGPWVLSILGILLIGLLSIGFVIPRMLITQFQVSVTYLIAGSLITDRADAVVVHALYLGPAVRAARRT